MPRRRRDHSHDESDWVDEWYPHDDEHPWHESGFEFEEHQRRGVIRRTFGCLLPIALVAGVGFGGWKAYEYLTDYFGGETCLLRGSNGGEEKLDPEQAANASTISTVATLKMGLPPRAAHIGLSTAIQESKLRNLNSGDRDSLGLFQQRPSQGWGTDAQITDPVYSATKFYDALVEVDDWQTRPLTEVAQDVQRSGHPDAYADHDAEGRVMSEAVTGETIEGVGCRIDQTDSGGDPAALADKLARQTGVSAQVQGNDLIVRASDARSARAIAAWGVTHANFESVTDVTVADRAWTRQRGRDGWSWHAADNPTESPQVVRIRVA